MSHEQDFEEFAKKYPDVMSKSLEDYISVGKGWHHILDSLFSLFTQRLETLRSTLRYMLEHPENQYLKTIDELEGEIRREEERIPQIIQIKEKFGGLRLYTGPVDSEYDNYIRFAEAISSRTCEVCGAPGKLRQGAWLKILCDEDHRKREGDNEIFQDEDFDA